MVFHSKCRFSFLHAGSNSRHENMSTIESNKKGLRHLFGANIVRSDKTRALTPSGAPWGKVGDRAAHRPMAIMVGSCFKPPRGQLVGLSAGWWRELAPANN
jgi:hypothetical protein